MRESVVERNARARDEGRRRCGGGVDGLRSDGRMGVRSDAACQGDEYSAGCATTHIATATACPVHFASAYAWAWWRVEATE